MYHLTPAISFKGMKQVMQLQKFSHTDTDANQAYKGIVEIATELLQLDGGQQ